MKDPTMSRIMRHAVLLILLTASGCGGSESTVPFNDDSQDADKYAASVKQIVADEVVAAVRSAEPADQISTIVGLLENPDSRPSGSHESVDLEILAAAKKLNEECATANGKPKDLAESLKNLKAISDKLPGTVVDSKPESD